MRFPYFFVTLVSAWAISCWNVAVALHSPNGVLFHWNSPSSHAKPVFSLTGFLSGTCQNAEPKSEVVKNFASPSLERLSSCGESVCVFYRHCVQVKEITTKPDLPPFFLAITTPQAHGTPLTSRSLSYTPPTYVASFSSPLPYEVPRHLLSQSPVLQNYSNLCRPYVSKNVCIPI